MGGSPSIPAPPDPVATANAQGAVNRETAYTNYALSRVNQESPYGKQTWVRNTSTPGGQAWDAYEKSYQDWQSKKSAYDAAGGANQQKPADSGSGHWETASEGSDGNQVRRWVQGSSLAPGGTSSPSSPVSDPGDAPKMPGSGIEDSWTLRTELDPAEQKMLDTTRGIGQNALDIGKTQLGRVSDSLSTPLNADGLPARIMGTWAPNYQPQVNPTARGITYDIGDTAGKIQYGTGYTGSQDLMGAAGGIQKSVDFSGLSNLPGISDFGGERQKVEDALYGRATSRLDPAWQQQENDLKVRLANQGVTVGSEAWQRELDAFNRAKNDAYSGARNDAIAAGGSEQSRLFADALAGRRQGYDETMGAGTFANSAQAQAFGELSSDRNRYTSELDRIRAANNDAQAQDFSQQQARSAFQNAAQQQEYGQNLSNAQFYNTTQSAAADRDLQRATFANNARDASMNERSTLRMAPLNELRGLMGMGAINAPQFGQVQTPQVAAPDLMGATYGSYNGQLSAANSAAANSTASTNGMMGLAGTGMMAAAMMFSDRRVKKDVRRIGTADNGLPLYSYRYVWGGPVQIGVMAQDVEKVIPDAVTEIDGIKAVDYRKVFTHPNDGEVSP